MNFDPLPDADNAAVGSHNDFFRRHCQTQCLIFFASNEPKWGACTPPWRLPRKPRKNRRGFRGLRATSQSGVLAHYLGDCRENPEKTEGVFGDCEQRAPPFNQAAMQRSIGGTTFGRYIKLMHKYTYEKGSRHYENSINNRWK